MKKIIALILALVLCIGLLAGCGSTNDTPPADSNTPSAEQPSGTPHIPPSKEPSTEPSVEPSAAPAERTYGTLTVEDINAGFLTFDRACLEGNIVYIEAGSNVTAETTRTEGSYGYIGPDALVIFSYPVIEGDEIRVKDYTYEDFFAYEIPVFTGCVDDITTFISGFDVPMLPVIITMEDDPLILVIE